MIETYHYTLSSTDKNIITPLTGVSTLQVKTYQDIAKKREVIFWFRREDVPNPENIINSGLRMYLKHIEEVAPNKFSILDNEGREFSLELLYVE